MLAGSEGPGGIPFDNPWLAHSLGVVALAFIIFAGGLDTNGSPPPGHLARARLSTLGVLAHGCRRLVRDVRAQVPWLEGLLLGAIVSSTDAAAVFAVLRSRSVSLKGELRPLLELESGSNDPMAVFLTVGFIGLVTGTTGRSLAMFPLFSSRWALGALLGYALRQGHCLPDQPDQARVRRAVPGPDRRAGPARLRAHRRCCQGNGFLAVYIAGLVMGNSTSSRNDT